jgi:hypothetical protein
LGKTKALDLPAGTPSFTTTQSAPAAPFAAFGAPAPLDPASATKKKYVVKPANSNFFGNPGACFPAASK